MPGCKKPVAAVVVRIVAAYAGLRQVKRLNVVVMSAGLVVSCNASGVSCQRFGNRPRMPWPGQECASLRTVVE